MFLYGMVLTLLFFGGIFGLIQWSLGMPAPFLWIIPAGILAIAMIYLAAMYGQKKDGTKCMC